MNFSIGILKSIFRDKAYLFLNVLGLALGIAGCILLILYVRYELSYDNFHENRDRIYRINCYAKLEGKDFSFAFTAPPQARAFVAEYPEIEDATRYYKPADFQKVHVDDRTYHEQNFFYADSNFLQMFNFPLEQGNPVTALNKPNTVIITGEIAEKLYGTRNVLGRNIVLGNKEVYQITGVISEAPLNSHFRFDYLASFVTLPLSKDQFWLSQMLETYILLQNGISYTNVEAKFEQLMDKYIIPQLGQIIAIKVNNYKEFEATGNVFQYLLQPLKEVRFNKEFSLGYGQSTNKVYVYFFSLVALFLLVIASINYMNLATARYSFRAKEVGIRKVAGSGRSSLIRQFLSESLLVTLFAMVVGLTIVELVLPAFNKFVGARLSLSYLQEWYVIPALIAFTVFTGLFAGIYPSFYLSSFNAIDILKSKFNNGPGNIRLRSGLVILQFTFTIILLICTFIVSSQLRYVRSKDLGYNKENLLIVKNTSDLGEQSESFRQQLLNTTGIINASRSWTFPGESWYGSSFQLQDDSLNHMFHFEVIEGDYEFIPTLGIKILNGRNFSRDFSTDTMSVLINQKAIAYTGLKDPVGAKFMTPDRSGGFDVMEIVGVMDDVYYKSLHELVQPTLVRLNTNKYNNYTIVRLSAGSIKESIKQVEKIWNEFLPHQPMEFTFVDSNLDTLYKSEMQAGTVFAMFSALAIFVACLGLLGLSAFTAEKRTKEIGVRKVLGASVGSIMSLLSREIILLVSISSIIAWPVVYYLMKKWLHNFAYQTNINLWIFPAASVIGLSIAITVVIYQSLKKATINPVEALKYE